MSLQCLGEKVAQKQWKPYLFICMTGVWLRKQINAPVSVSSEHCQINTSHYISCQLSLSSNKWQIWAATHIFFHTPRACGDMVFIHNEMQCTFGNSFLCAKPVRAMRTHYWCGYTVIWTEYGYLGSLAQLERNPCEKKILFCFLVVTLDIPHLQEYILGGAEHGSFGHFGH